MGRMLAEARCRAGVTQYDAAEAANVSRATVINWENGVSNPDIFQIEDLLEYYGEDPIYRLKNYRNTRLYDMLNKSGDLAQIDEQAINEELIHIINSEMSKRVKMQLLFLFSYEHGRDPDAIMQEMNAILQIPLRSGHAVAVLVRSLYDSAVAHKELNCPESIKPDIDIWETATLAGFHAVKDRRGGYVIKGDNK